LSTATTTPPSTSPCTFAALEFDAEIFNPYTNSDFRSRHQHPRHTTWLTHHAEEEIEEVSVLVEIEEVTVAVVADVVVDVVAARPRRRNGSPSPSSAVS
jgi:hypothetical protein